MRALTVLFLVPSVTFFSIGVLIQTSFSLPFKNRIDMEAEETSENFDVFAHLTLSNDGKYYDPLHSKYYFGYYFNGYGGLSITGKNLSFSAGKLIQKDEIHSPYSLFLSSEKKPYVSMKLSYENTWFFFKTIWIELTKKISVESPTFSYSFPDRGMNYRVIGLKFGKLRIGYQESIVYTKRTFDFEYFFNPLPNFFTQYINVVGRPFKQGTNDNSILGFFTDYRSTDFHWYAQVLVDDLNMDRFYGGYQNPDKIAWSLGLSMHFPIGELYVYHAGSTKYTFEPSAADISDEYFRYPSVIAPLGESTRVVSPEEGYIGYKYGENALSFMIGFEPNTKGIDTDLHLEMVLSGAKSPINPWHELKIVPSGTHLLDDKKIEKIFRATGNVQKSFGSFSTSFTFSFEHIENPLRVVNGTDGDGALYRPSNGVENSLNISVKFSYRF